MKDPNSNGSNSEAEYLALKQMYLAGDFARLIELLESTQNTLSNSRQLTQAEVKKFNLLGSAYLQIGQPTAASDCLEYLHSNSEPSFDLCNNLGVAFFNQKKWETGKDYLQQAIQFDNAPSTSFILLALIHQKLNEQNESINCLEDGLLKYPADSGLIRALGDCYFHFSNFSKAYIQYQNFMKDGGQLHTIVDKLAICIGYLSSPSKGLSLLSSVVPNNNISEERVLSCRAKLYAMDEKFDLALEHQLNLTSSHPTASSFCALGTYYKALRKTQEAYRAFQRSLDLDPFCVEAFTNLTNCGISPISFGPIHHKLEDLLNKGELSHSQSSNVHFGLARTYESNQVFSKAFDHFVLGNKSRRESLKGASLIEPEVFFRRIIKLHDQIRSLDKPQFSSPAKTTVPIFVVGMPRSGTSLVEQILTSNTLVSGGGELRYIDELCGSFAKTSDCVICSDSLRSIREKYLSRIFELTDRPYITDKMPQNFAYLSFISYAFPEAKIIHCVRNPKAVCWSNFKTEFTSIGLFYSTDLSDTVDYFQRYYDLMKLWRDCNYIKMFDLNYEKLVEEPRQTIENLLKFVGLEAQERCFKPHLNDRVVSTASSAQVGRPIYKGSSEEWRNYESQLSSSFIPLEKFSH